VREGGALFQASGQGRAQGVPSRTDSAAEMQDNRTLSAEVLSRLSLRQAKTKNTLRFPAIKEHEFIGAMQSPRQRNRDGNRLRKKVIQRSTSATPCRNGRLVSQSTPVALHHSCERERHRVQYAGSGPNPCLPRRAGSNYWRVGVRRHCEWRRVLETPAILTLTTGTHDGNGTLRADRRWRQIPAHMSASCVMRQGPTCRTDQIHDAPSTRIGQVTISGFADVDIPDPLVSKISIRIRWVYRILGAGAARIPVSTGLGWPSVEVIEGTSADLHGLLDLCRYWERPVFDTGSSHCLHSFARTGPSTAYGCHPTAPAAVRHSILLARCDLSCLPVRCASRAVLSSLEPPQTRRDLWFVPSLFFPLYLRRVRSRRVFEGLP
jgi:hypothetical protein